ncbi:MAG: hypothetical protein ACI38U_07785 [Corynebacterium sp.]|uniref:hypothetical protein n=1 Tax=Corynebacterium sp. TaxID=1720 RepID=UPI003F04EB2B
MSRRKEKKTTRQESAKASRDSRKQKRQDKAAQRAAEWDAKSPKEKRNTKIGCGLIIAAVVVVGVIVANMDTEEDDDSTSSTVSETSTQVPPQKVEEPDRDDSSTVEETPEQSGPTDQEIEAAFNDFLQERVDNVPAFSPGAHATFANRVVTATFQVTDANRSFIEMMDLTDVAGSPIAFNDDQGERLRPAVDRVDVVDQDGNSLGSATTEEIHERATGGM